MSEIDYSRPPKSLITEMGRILDKILDSQRESPEVRQRVPNIDAFLDYVSRVLAWRERKVQGLPFEEEEKEVNRTEKDATRIGFKIGNLCATCCVISYGTPNLMEVEKWRKRIRLARIKKAKREG